MSESVDTSPSAGTTVPSVIGASSSGFRTLSSGVTSSSEHSSSSRRPRPSDTSYGLTTLAGDLEKLDDFVKLRPNDLDYMVAAREFFQKEPVFRKKFKVWLMKMKSGEGGEKEFWKMIRATRRLQISYRSRSSYTQLRRELIRRQPRTEAMQVLVKAMSDLSVNKNE